MKTTIQRKKGARCMPLSVTGAFCVAAIAFVFAGCATKGGAKNHTKGGAPKAVPTVSTLPLGGGKVQTFDLGDFKLHTYATGDPMDTMSNIIEGKDALVVVEYASFYTGIDAEKAYLAKLGKPVENVIADYHLAGLEEYSPDRLVLVAGMPEFAKTPMFTGMLASFAEEFHGAMDTKPIGDGTEVPLNSVQKFAGIDFGFTPGSSNDFPGAAIVISGKTRGPLVRYTHWAPEKAHCSPLQVANDAAIDAVLADLKAAKDSGCILFTGGHGIGVAGIDAVDFQIAYFTKAKELRKTCATADEFAAAMNESYPTLPGSDNLTAFARSLYR